MNKKILTVTLNPCIDKTITIEGFEYGGLNRATKTRVDVGGKGINVAKVLSNFDSNVYACGIVAGKQGQEVISFLDKKGIQNSFVKNKGETRTNYKIFDSKSKTITEINEPGFYVDKAILQECIDNIAANLMQTEIMILSGSIPSGIDSGIYEKLISIANKCDVKVILDAGGDELRQGANAVPFAIKPNLFEFEQLLGRKPGDDTEIVEAAKEYINKGVGMVIISMGGDGAIFVTKEQAYKAYPFNIECKSTVGAGDSMVATVAYGISKGLEFEQTVKMASAAGSITAAKEGTQVCTFYEIMSNFERVCTKKI